MLARIRSAVGELKRHGTDPIWWKRFVRRRLVGELYYGLRPNTGTFVMEEDWDNLIILDACRYDLFADVLSDIAADSIDDLESRTSRGTSTVQFLEQNFADGPYPDTVYVTANPWVTVHAGGAFHAVIDVWDDGWSETHQTVLPETVHSRAMDAAAAYPNKRLIVHFMQPHYPFVEAELDTDVIVSWKDSRARAKGATDTIDAGSIWNVLEQGRVSPDAVWAAYRSNLELVLPYAIDVATEVAGKSVITSDHGNGIGEWCWPFPVRVYGHPRNIRVPAVVTVPWLSVASSERKRITAADATDAEPTTDRQTVEDRLSALGYTP